MSLRLILAWLLTDTIIRKATYDIAISSKYRGEIFQLSEVVGRTKRECIRRPHLRTMTANIAAEWVHTAAADLY